MLSLWKCEYCDLNNFPENKQCQACFNNATRLSPIGRIMYDQDLLFHGYVRLRILAHLNVTLIPYDVMNVCKLFYIFIFLLIVLHLKTYSSERSERVRAKRGVVKRRA